MAGPRPPGRVKPFVAARGRSYFVRGRPLMAERSTPWRMRASLLAPPFALFLFLMHPAVALVRAGTQLADPGIGWHLVTGRYIWETGSVPGGDIFSFTAAGHPWVSYCWLFEVLGALLVRAGGLPLFATVCMLVYALIPALLFRRMVRMGSGLAPAFVATALAYVTLLSHAIARPHIATYVFFAILLEQLDDHENGRLPARGLWWLPLLMMAWANMHGGFVAGLATVVIYAGCAAARYVLARDGDAGRRAVTFATLLVAMLLATLVNPAGVRLHLSILQYLGMQSVGYFDEFRAPDLWAGGAAVHSFELLAVSVVLLLGWRWRQASWVEVVLVVFFLHEALASARHMNLFVIVAAPIVARELTPLMERAWPASRARLRAIAAEQARRPTLGWFAVASAVFLWLALAGRLPYPSSLDGLRLSAPAAAFIDAHRQRFTRPFNTIDISGALIYRFWPDLHVFVDDRVFIYGDDFVLNKYFPLWQGVAGSERVLEEYGITSAVVSSEAPCAGLFRASQNWETAFEDGMTAIFLRRDGRPSGHP
jgi:hypothetical protein